MVTCAGGVPKWPTGADCKSAGSRLRRFESFPHHNGAGFSGRRVGSVYSRAGWNERRDGQHRAGFAGVAQLVERKPSKLDVAGSSPVSRSEGRTTSARVAQSVEHPLGKGEVIGSIPIACSGGT